MKGSTRFWAGTVVLSIVSCGNRGTPEPASVETVESSEALAHEDTFPRRIYHDLTKYEWYSRAEPLVVEQTAFQPQGAPASIPLAKLYLTGNYQGVDYYTLRADADRPDALYVPVYEGYWLKFTPVGAAQAGD